MSIFKLQRKYINIIALNENEIDVVIRGPWVHTILFEVPVLSIINEVYFRQTQNTEHFVTGRERLQVKIQKVCELNNKEFKFSDFGTRRRYSRDWQEEVIVAFKNALPDNFTGTSNVLFAMRHNLTPIGTMAHEFLQGCQALGPRLRDSQKFAFDKWVQEFRGDLGIALTDVIGMEAFCADFDLFFCKLFDGVRHDSGDPVIWGNRMIEHYESMKIDPKTKIFVFSDGLNIDKSIELFQTFYGKVKTFFGIGTNLTNDMGVKALNIVIKMTSCNGSPVAKISDSPGKSMCKNEEYLAYLRQVFSVK